MVTTGSTYSKSDKPVNSTMAMSDVSMISRLRSLILLNWASLLTARPNLKCRIWSTLKSS